MIDPKSQQERQERLERARARRIAARSRYRQPGSLSPNAPGGAAINGFVLTAIEDDAYKATGRLVTPDDPDEGTFNFADEDSEVYLWPAVGWEFFTPLVWAGSMPPTGADWPTILPVFQWGGVNYVLQIPRWPLEDIDGTDQRTGCPTA